MVDVSAKSDTERLATAEAIIAISKEAFDLVVAGEVKKGDVLATARIAGIMAAKKSSELIPLCHPLALSHAGIEFEPIPERNAFRILASAKTTGPTGVEMEALTAASVAALTVYDMIKAVDKSAVIESVRLLSKSGGKSGTYAAHEKTPSAPPDEPVQASRGRKAAPRILMHEVAPSKQNTAPGEKDAFRRFMQDRRLRATEWAKSSGVPVNEIFGYLNGTSRSIAAASAQKLAKAARASVDEMFGRKTAR